MDKYFVDSNGVIQATTDLLQWAELYGRSAFIPFEQGGRWVARDYISKDVYVSTVFLGNDYAFGHSPLPVLFETLVFGGEHDGYGARSCTLKEAHIEHLKSAALAEKSPSTVICGEDD